MVGHADTYLDWAVSLLICDECHVLKNENGEVHPMVAPSAREPLGIVLAMPMLD